MAPRTGFSLVELSIVLVILGLLVGGVLSGQSLIHAAELRSVTADMGKYVTATYTFRDKYFALPGDMNNATQFWGSAGGNGNNAACDTAISAASKAVCNGDGDGWIDTSTTAGINFNERFYAWKELANAALIEGSYTGKSSYGTGNANAIPGTDMPKPKMSNLQQSFAVTTLANAPDVYVTRQTNNIYWAAGGNPGFKPEDAWNIDTKLDDGKPSTGKVYTSNHTSTFYSIEDTCTDASTPPNYTLTNSSVLCVLWIAIL